MKRLSLVLVGTALLAFTSCTQTDVPNEESAVAPNPESAIENNEETVQENPSKADFTVTIENVVTPKPIFQSGVFAIPTGGTEPAPLFPGDFYEFTVDAGPRVLPPPTGDMGTRLSFVTMFVQSNDLFYAPGEEGIPLYHEDGTPIGADGPEDVTYMVDLWDAGTEVNEETGGPNQKPQQDPAAEDQGEDENGVVTKITNNSCSFGNVLPENGEVIKVTIENMGPAMFKVRIKNVSDETTIAVPVKGKYATAPVPLSPGVYAVHTMPAPFFVEGEPASGAGLIASAEGVENIAEDGFPEALAMDAKAATGLIVPLSPGAWAIHEKGVQPLYMIDSPDYGEGLEAVAEDGIPTMLVTSLKEKMGVKFAGAFDTAIGADGPGAIGPGGSYQFTCAGTEGDYLSLATMFVQSNDWFYSFAQDGIPLFKDGTATEGDVTEYIYLYDAGTEADEYPGAGLSQVIRQGGADAGAMDSNTNVRLIDPSALPNVPETAYVIKVTISASTN